jgi:hypothetical protein
MTEKKLQVNMDSFFAMNKKNILIRNRSSLTISVKNIKHVCSRDSVLHWAEIVKEIDI